MALLMILTLPYVLSIPHDKIRSSIFSCWLGISCVLIVQLTGIMRAGTQPEVLIINDKDVDDGEHRLPKAGREREEPRVPRSDRERGKRDQSEQDESASPKHQD